MGQIGIRSVNATILNGQALSAEVAFGDRVPVGLVVPAAFDGTALTFQVSTDGGTTWSEFYDASGNEVTVTVAPGRYIYLDPTVWIGVNDIKVRSGTAAMPTNQTSDRVLTFVTRY
ncbi:hypothetical protein [Bradyrhizobium sp. SZCCHNR1020]|uniref:hypothetical protein n=1 Tax=Bradyrhizobium sp. SZCCHNR1020 TaxID=3057343 RepID=UPI00291672BA|nr:hypothetical protein [Bradyrhizobium sp. SZCCHNR1020]